MARLSGGDRAAPYPAKKNKTDNSHTPDVVPLRYLWAFAGPVISDARAFLASKSHSAEEVERMHQAWAKSVLLTLTLWARPYVKDSLWCDPALRTRARVVKNCLGSRRRRQCLRSCLWRDAAETMKARLDAITS